MKPETLIVAGVMSGTSGDGIDVALAEIGPRTMRGEGSVRLKLLAHESFPFPKALRAAVLGAQDAKSISTAELARLNWRLGIAYADAVEATQEKHQTVAHLIGCHGQTIYHQAQPAAYAGERFACTWQIGEPALIATRLQIPVVSNFRPADMVVGGQGAPLVPLLDYVMFADTKVARVLQNIGGIGNLTAIPAGGGADEVMAFDTGPGNMAIDALMQQLFGKPYDRDGRIAARGRVLESIVESTLRMPFFQKAPPKSAGREQFGAAFTQALLAACRKERATNEDVLATATAITAETIARGFARFVQPVMGSAPVEYILSGGGARNLTLVRMLRERLEPMGCKLFASDEVGMPAAAKEAAAFALLAYCTYYGLPGNLPSATGAIMPVVLGTISHG
uniref:Anhydro-N-acetylmuramic acid kinase n=1 Tax=Acidobacterium capsulatum TaxID=33075 RepID=A0A7V4XT64_9BACT